MNKGDIEERIKICNKRANDYREVGKTRLAEAYENEKFKWEQLLTQLRPREKDYIIGYNNLKFKLIKIKRYIKDVWDNTNPNPRIDVVLSTLDKMIGDDIDGEI